MNAILMTFFGLLFTPAAQADWSNPPSDQQQFQRYQYPFRPEEIQSFRETLNKAKITTNSESRKIQVAKGVITGGGGGTGIACFPSEAIAQAAVSSGGTPEVKGRLNPAYINQIKSLVVLDMYRPNGMLQMSYFPRSGTPYTYVLDVVRKQLSRKNPVFAKKVELALEAIGSPERWFNSSWLPYLNDTGVSLPAMQDCPATRFVQLVVRYERSNKGEMPALAIDADYALLSLLRRHPNPDFAFYSEALLILHEAVYALATQPGAENARLSRELVGDILNPQSYKDGSLEQRIAETFFRLNQYYAKDVSQNATPSYLQTIDKHLTDYMHSLMDPVIKAPETIWDIQLGKFSNQLSALQTALRHKDWPDAESFLFLSRYVVGAPGQVDPQVEGLYLNPNQNPHLKSDLCVVIAQIAIPIDLSKLGQKIPHSSLPFAPAIFNRALDYCKSENLYPITREQQRGWGERRYGNRK